MTPTKEQIREQYLANQLFLLGEKVGSLEVIDRRANYIVVVNQSGETSKMFLDEAYAVRLSETYSPTEGKSLSDLEGELHQVYKDYPEYHDAGYHAMVDKFAADPFYKLHAVAKEYLKAPTEYRKAPNELKEGRLRFSSFVAKTDAGFSYKGYKPRNFQDHPDAQAVFESLTKNATDPFAVLSAIKHVDIFFEKRDEHSLDIARTAVAKIDKVENHPYLSESKEDFLKDSAVKHVVYHGTVNDVHRFDSNRHSHASNNPSAHLGFFFHSDPHEAATFAIGSDHHGRLTDNGANVMPVHLSIKNPYEMSAGEFLDLTNSVATSHKHVQELRTNLERQGHDGVVVRADPEAEIEELQTGDTWVAFHPHQIKSAIGNNGNFSLKSSKITEDTIKDEEIDFKIEEKLTYSTMTQFLNESFEHHVHTVLDHLEKNPTELDKLADHVKVLAHIAHHYDHHTVHMSESEQVCKSCGRKKSDHNVRHIFVPIVESAEGKAIEHAEGGPHIRMGKLSSGPQLVKVAKRAAVELIAQRLANKPVKKISNKEKDVILDAIRKKKTVVMKLARKLVPKIRRIEHEHHEEHTQEFGSAE